MDRHESSNTDVDYSADSLKLHKNFRIFSVPTSFSATQFFDTHGDEVVFGKKATVCFIEVVTDSL